MHLYNQFIDICKLLIGYVTTQRLIYGALISLAFFLVWTALANHASSIKRFYKRCAKLEKYLRKNNVGYENIDSLDRFCRKISNSFFYGWSKFKRQKSNDKKPSDFLNKRDVLDSEVSGGMLNHGKTLMKTFIGITTVLLFIFNLAFIGKDATFTFNVLVEAMFLPFVYYVVMILVYFISNLIRQQIYIIASSHFYSLVDSLDRIFDAKVTEEIEIVNKKGINDFVDEQSPVKEETHDELSKEQIVNEQIVEESDEETKNIEEDIDELSEDTLDINESENSSEPVAKAVDLSQFEILNNSEEKDISLDESIQLGEENNLGKIEEELEVVDTQKEEDLKNVDTEIEENENVEVESDQEVQNSLVVTRNWEAEENLDYYDVFKKKNIDVDKYINEIPDDVEQEISLINENANYFPNDELSDDLSNDSEIEKVESVEELLENEVNNDDEKVDEDLQEDILEEISENEEEDESTSENVEEQTIMIDSNNEQEENTEADLSDEESKQESNKEQQDEDSVFDLNDLLGDEEAEFELSETDDEQNNEQTDLENTQELESIENNEEFNLEDINSSNDEIEANEFDFFKDDSVEDVDIFEEENIDEESELKSKIEQNLNDSSKEIDMKLEDNIDFSALVDEFKQNHDDASDNIEDVEKEEKVEESLNEINNSETIDDNNINTKDIYKKINDLEDLIYSAISKEENNQKEDKANNKSGSKSKKSKKGKSKMTGENEKKTRGRPKMRIIDESLTIKNDEEFEEILSRAEKLMRKSEEGLSASQSKRIEKELKIMVDAMNKYKEGGN